MEGNFVGIIHHVPTHPNHPRYGKYRGLDHFLQSDVWNKSKTKCKGMFTLCEYTCSYLKDKVPCEVASILHPILNWNTIEFNFKEFEKNKKVYFIGNFLKNFDPFIELKTPLRKAFVSMGLGVLEQEGVDKKGIDIIEILPRKDYELLLSKSIVFANYVDVACSGVIMECMTMNTPIALNRKPAAEEYLGIDYPLFYENLEEAEKKLKDMNIIQESHLYLKNMDKTKFTINHMIESIEESAVYKNLPNPIPML
jgi:hypothetical protein